MRSLTVEALLVALPSLIVNAAAVYWGNELRAAAVDGSWLASPSVYLASCTLYGFAVTWLVYWIAGDWLEHRPLAISTGATLLLFMTGLITLLGLLYFPVLALGLAASAIGSAFALKALRVRPSRRIRRNPHKESGA